MGMVGWLLGVVMHGLVLLHGLIVSGLNFDAARLLVNVKLKFLFNSHSKTTDSTHTLCHKGIFNAFGHNNHLRFLSQQQFT